MEYLSRRGGTPPKWNIYPEGGGTPPQWNIYPEGGGTPPQWNIYPEGGGGQHHLSGIFFPASHFPQCSIFHPFFFSRGGCSPVLHGLPFFPTFNFHDGFCSGGWLCWGGGSGRLFLVPFWDEGRTGGIGYHTFIRLLLRCVLFYVLDTRCQIRLQTSNFVHIAGGHPPSLPYGAPPRGHPPSVPYGAPPRGPPPSLPYGAPPWRSGRAAGASSEGAARPIHPCGTDQEGAWAAAEPTRSYVLRCGIQCVVCTEP